MKRTGHLFEKIIDLENIKLAIWKSSAKKRDQRRVRRVLDDIDTHARHIQYLLAEKKYTPSEYIIKTIQDSSNGKTRTIYKPRYFPDQVIHWALMIVLEPIIKKGMYAYSCGSVPKRGTSLGQKTVRKWIDNDQKNMKYCLKLDVSQYYPSVNNQLLKDMFRRKVKDADCLWLIDSIIDSERGLPIGNYTSQWFSNFFLQDLDHYIKQELGVKYYIRYVDDLVLFGANKRKLRKVFLGLQAFLTKLKLTVKGNWQLFRTNSRPIDFLGVRFYADRSTLRRRNALRIMRRMRKIRKKGYLNVKDASAIISYWGWIKKTNSYHFYNNYVRPIVPMSVAKRKVSEDARLRNRERRRAAHEQNAAGRLQAA